MLVKHLNVPSASIFKCPCSKLNTNQNKPEVPFYTHQIGMIRIQVIAHPGQHVKQGEHFSFAVGMCKLVQTHWKLI